MPLRIVNGRTPEQWADIIKSKWQDNVQGTLDVGISLHNSREELGNHAFAKMVRENLRYATSTVKQLIQIGSDAKLLSVAMATLPASWRTLYDLTRLTDEQFQKGLDSGIIHAGMERRDIAQLKPPKDTRPRPPKPLAGFPVDHPIEEIATSMRTNVFGWLNDLAFDEWRPLIIRLRYELDDIERDFPGIEAEMREEGKAA